MSKQESLEQGLAQVAAAIADGSRARMLCALMDGRAWTATELSLVAEVSASTASSHLARLQQQGLTACVRQGKHRYYRIASHDVALVVEQLMGLVDMGTGALRSKTPERLRFARSCYDHLAGELGVRLHDGLMSQGWLEAEGHGLTPQGEQHLGQLGIDCVATGKRPFACHCLDWSERRMHLGGQLGARLLGHMLNKRWLVRGLESRELTLTPKGKRQLQRQLGIVL
ncbi:Helix-turn-helix domain protein [compost metagenome]